MLTKLRMKDGLGANKVKESRTPDWDGGVVGKSQEARYQFGIGEHLLTKLRMKDGGMRAYKSRERLFVQDGNVVEKGKSDVKAKHGRRLGILVNQKSRRAKEAKRESSVGEGKESRDGQTARTGNGEED